MDPLAFLSDDEGEATVEALMTSQIYKCSTRLYSEFWQPQDEFVLTSIPLYNYGN